ncbi:Ig-like protein group 2 [Stackebrandtia albiflava]|uniref:Ig-like protein group 2 n=1 Tax=Stackebrandtia albiflava TaxID=406432 RepID=A0A562V3M2_9ACTN|nr:phosphodiester glycosidase family protein [Stackebrandtia albiflava]TWJ12455.1 Ig-like protein group 2 [Stackebrandtia albiflava]
MSQPRRPYGRAGATVLAVIAPVLLWPPGAAADSQVTEAVETDRTTTPIATGVTLDSFDRWSADGWLRADALTVDLSTGATVDYLSPGTVSDTAPISEQVQARPEAVAAVNGDFFDINDTGAPNGVAVSDGELVKSGNSGRGNAVAIDPAGFGAILQVDFEGTVTLPGGEHDLAALNTNTLPNGAIGEYTSLWGSADRSRVVDGAAETFEVTVTDGVVTAVSETPGKGPIDADSFVLIGREAGADTLSTLRVGDPVTAEYSPRTSDDSALRTAVGGNQLLVVDGEIQSHPDDGQAARAAVGFSADGTVMYLMTVDGKQANSAGITVPQMAELMAELGAHNALNIDGGGSATMLARKPGDSEPTIVNSPSDGSERPVANGLAVSVPAGSGTPTGYRVEPAMPTPDAPTDAPLADGRTDRVFPGLTRQLTATGYDETYAPADGDPRWSTTHRKTGRVDHDGTFTGVRPGVTTVKATSGDAHGDIDMTVLGELCRIDSATDRVGLPDAGATGRFGLVGYDAAGYTAPIDPADVTLEYDTALLDITTGPAGFTVTATTDSVATLVTARAGGQETVIPVTVGLEQRTVAEFEDAADWTFSAARATGSLQPVPGRTGDALGMSYDFTQSTATRAAYAAPPQLVPVPGQPQSFSVWIEGSANGEWPTLHFIDGNGATLLLRSDYVTWEGWRQVTFTVPSGTVFPLSLRRIYFAEVDPTASYHGRIAFDDLVANVPPDVDVPAEPTPTDSIYTSSVAGSDWRFAVMSDAQFVAADPDSDIVASARRTLAEIKAAEPDFLIVNGDLVDEGSPADLAFARQLLTEELGDDLPWYYVPGNHEVMGGKIDNFVDEFGPAYATFDHEGTRFITLDTSSLNLRGGGYPQLAMFREQLDAAAADDAVDSVVVVAHVPPRDPLPQAGSQLGDRKDAQVVEDWLGEFTATTGKGAGFVGSHVGVFHASTVDGVPYVINGNSGKGPAAGPELGGFIGWSEFGVDRIGDREQRQRRDNPYAAGPQDWLSVATHVQLDSLALAAPETVAVGDTVAVTPTLVQQGETMPVGYPMSADWSASEGVHVGTDAPQGRRYRAWFNPDTGELTGLRHGEIVLTVTVNGVTETVTVEVTRR